MNKIEAVGRSHTAARCLKSFNLRTTCRALSVSETFEKRVLSSSHLDETKISPIDVCYKTVRFLFDTKAQGAVLMAGVARRVRKMISSRTIIVLTMILTLSALVAVRQGSAQSGLFVTC